VYLLLNHDEVVIGLAKRILAQHLKKIEPGWTNTTAYLEKINRRIEKSGPIDVDFATLNGLIRQDLEEYKDSIVVKYKKKYRPLVRWLAKNFKNINVDRDYLLYKYINSDVKNFVKTLGQQLTDQPVWTLPGDPIPDDQTVVLRNIINNESVLQHRLAAHLPFWFIDSGYTNFITGKKLWHRLVKNHIHHSLSKKSYFPADRLHLLPSMPTPWRDGGGAILVVENSEYHYQMFGTTLSAWREQVRTELQKYTNRSVVFRPKELNRKIRDNLYEHLQQSDYYCVITDASSAAIEAVWAGTPIITLGRHVSTTVARTRLSDINDLYRGPIGNWLCALSYSQFTQKEMYNGTALKLIKKYHV
jgi:hypothetical protein